MKIILKHPSETVPGNHDSSVFTEVIPESMDAQRLAEQFCVWEDSGKAVF